MMTTEEEKRVTYCKVHNIHHLFELLASRLLVDRPENPFEYLRRLLSSVEESEKNKQSYDPTMLPSPAGGGVAVPLKRITLGAFGIDNAGKTTIISALGGNIDKNATPTVGFTPTRFQTDTYDICIFDLGGGANFRGIWVHYFHDCHGLIYVIDSAADENVIQESLDVLRNLAQNEHVRGKPLLLLANKKDLKGSRGVKIVPGLFFEEMLERGTMYRIVASCGIEEDPELEEGVEWLLSTVGSHYDGLEARVQRDTVKVKEEAKRKAKERLASLNASE